MKKFLSILLTLCIIGTLVAMPISVSAETLVAPLDLSNPDIIKYTPFSSTTAYPSDGSPNTEFADYPLSNLFDGNINTTAILNLDGISRAAGGSTNKPSNSKVFLYSDLVIDLGDDYTLSSVTLARPTTDAKVQEIVANYSDYLNKPTNQGTASKGSILFYQEDPTLNASATSYNPVGTINGGTFTCDTTNKYRYLRIIAGAWGNNGSLLLNELTINVEVPDSVVSFETTAAASEDAIRFYVEPTISDAFATKEFGMYIVPFDLFNDDATINGVQMIQDGKIVTGQNYAADLVDIPAEAADEPVIAVPFVNLGSGYIFGDPSAQYTLNN